MDSEVQQGTMDANSGKPWSEMDISHLTHALAPWVDSRIIPAASLGAEARL
jgi:hypothetical protein